MKARPAWFLVLLAGLVTARMAVADPPTTERPGAAPPGTHGVPGIAPVLRPDQIEKRISPEERERLGLPEPTWVAQQGKVHPDVPAVLQTGQMPWLRFKGWEQIGFEGTAYVAVSLRYEEGTKRTLEKNRAAIKELQRGVLSRLTARDFSLVFAFRDTPGLTGYVSADGLGKLAKDADVLAVCLDDKPVPEIPAPDVEKPPAPGVVQGPTQRRGKVEVPVYEALEKSKDGYVEVVVDVAAAPVPAGSSREAYDAHKSQVRKLQDRVLSSLTAEEFRLKSRCWIFFDGYVNAAGLAKLASQPEVEIVGSVGPLVPVPKVTKEEP